MPSERTPLIQTVVVGPHRQRYPHNVLRRFCSIFLGVALIVIAILFLIPQPWDRHSSPTHPDPDAPENPWEPIGPPIAQSATKPKHLNYEALEKLILRTPRADKVRQWSYYYTAGPHLAGQNLSQAEYTRDLWESFGIKSRIVAYDIYINYPLDHRLALLEVKNGSALEEGSSLEVKHECSLEEDVLQADPTTGLEERIPTFHGYSCCKPGNPAGNVTAQYVYANFGTYRDFEDLVDARVELKGKIALVKYGRIFRGLKVSRAQQLGMVGVVMYSDPQEDGPITEQNGYMPYPAGPARNPSAVQRGSVQFLSQAPGDPTTIGYPSLPGVPRQDPVGTIPSIPSIPISYTDAMPLLLALNGMGRDASSFNKYWQGGGLSYLGVRYSIGPSPPELVLNLQNTQNYTITPIWNVIGIVNGTSMPDQTVIVGNHRDAWIAGGGADPNSGSAALNEVVRSFGNAMSQGWKPKRNMVFASWDGEEYGLIGSTEWVEEYLPWLNDSALAYLNMDVGCAGPKFGVSASPLLSSVLRDAAGKVISPNQTVKGQTVGDIWQAEGGHIGTMGSGSDFTAFQDYAGVPSLDAGFMPKAGSAVYHYHSNYDSFHWMDTYGDMGWEYHVTAARILGMMTLQLTEKDIVSFNTTEYAMGLARYLGDAKTKHNASLARQINLEGLSQQVEKLYLETLKFERRSSKLAEESEMASSWRQKAGVAKKVKVVNEKYLKFERQFLHAPGLDGRDWFKHVVFAPGKWTGYAGATFPGLVEALDAGNGTRAEEWANVIAEKVKRARKLLES